jgi:hypothetical protein
MPRPRFTGLVVIVLVALLAAAAFFAILNLRILPP